MLVTVTSFNTVVFRVSLGCYANSAIGNNPTANNIVPFTLLIFLSRKSGLTGEKFVYIMRKKLLQIGKSLCYILTPNET